MMTWIFLGVIGFFFLVGSIALLILIGWLGPKRFGALTVRNVYSGEVMWVVPSSERPAPTDGKTLITKVSGYAGLRKEEVVLDGEIFWERDVRGQVFGGRYPAEEYLRRTTGVARAAIGEVARATVQRRHWEAVATDLKNKQDMERQSDLKELAKIAESLTKPQFNKPGTGTVRR